MSKPWNEIDKMVVEQLEADIRVHQVQIDMLRMCSLKIRSKYELTDRENVINSGRY